MHRWPLAVATSEDGINFSNLLTLTTHVPPTRYEGWAKNLGPNMSGEFVKAILSQMMSICGSPIV